MKSRTKFIQNSIRLIPIIMLTIIITLVLFVSQATVSATTPQSTSNDGLWHEIAERDFQPQGERLIVPETYRTLSLNLANLQAMLAQPTAVVSFPLPDGTFSRFTVQETAVMHPELAAKFPEIKTYAGTSLDGLAATIRLDITPNGFHGMILSAGDTVYIDPYSRQDTAHYISYYRQNLANRHKDFIQHEPLGDASEIEALVKTMKSGGGNIPSGDELRTYRLVVAATGEYTQYHGGTVPLAMAEIVTAVNRVVGIYIRDTAISMQLVANNDLVIYTNGNTDPYTNNSGGAMLGQNQTNLDAVIGDANYDIGHVFSTGGGGIASLGVPCRTGVKARGVTGLPNPIGDPFYVDYVAHEMGHQYAGNHTFNGNTGACSGGNRNASTAYEPGSGTTIMAYAGICGNQNIQPNSDDHFHTGSIDEIRAYTTVGAGNGCPIVTNTTNLPPTVNAGLDYTIPVNTPFTLVGSATDPNGDALTYNWEQFDIGPAGHPDAPVGNAPLFRSFSSVLTSTRTLPQISDIVNNVHTIGEILPSYARNLTFHLTVRDNRMEAGGVNMDDMTISVADTAGPFEVIAPNTAVTWSTGSSETITWDVANTAQAPVSCANVDLRLSLDGGYTYPVLIEANRPNDGNEDIIVPDNPTTQARIKVQCSDNIFFDISDANFTIILGSSDFLVSASPDIISECVPTDAIYDITVGSLQGYNQTVTLSSAGQPDPPNTVSFSVNNQPAPYTSTMTVGTIGATAGAYNIDVVGIGPTSTHTATVQLNLFTAAPGAPTLVTPGDGASNISVTPLFEWTAVAQASSYFLEVATDAAFSSVVYSTNTSTTSHTIPAGSELASNTTYYWRITAGNGCGSGTVSATFSFTTEPLAGDCSPGSTPVTVYSEDFESGAGGWTHSAGQGSDTWTLSSSNPHSGSMAFHADDVASISDQYLVSPAIVLPSGQSPLTLQFWNYQAMEDRSGGCFDGGILEISTDGGSTWDYINSGLLTDAYDGPISTNWGNPLGGVAAWCGDPQAYLNSIVDIDAYAGQSVQFRFRLATDSSEGRPGWDVDDVTVQACASSANSAPVAVADVYSTTQALALTVAAPGILDNDTDGDGDGLTAVLDTTTSHGALLLNGDGSFVYTPTLGFAGDDTFTYHAHDGLAGSNVVTVTITVLNMAPVAVADTFTMTMNSLLSISAPGVLGNDSDADGDSMTAVLDADVSHGSLTLNADGSFTYTPAVGFSGSDSFTYHAFDGSDTSNVVSVMIVVEEFSIFLPLVLSD